MHRFQINIGDGSGDGHGIKEPRIIDCSLTLEEFTEAYEKACKITNFQWHTNGNSTSREGTWLNSEFKILNDYQVDRLTEPQKEMFKKHNIDTIEDFSFETDEVLKLFVAFVKIGNPTLEYNVVVNSQFQTFDHSVGYGAFDN